MPPPDALVAYSSRWQKHESNVKGITHTDTPQDAHGRNKPADDYSDKRCVDFNGTGDDGSTATAEESVNINLQFSIDELQAQCDVLPTLPNGIDLVLGNNFLSTFDVLIRNPSGQSRMLLVQRSSEETHGDTRLIAITSMDELTSFVTTF